MNSLVSIIIPVYNGEKYLAQALESVAAQDYAPLEVIVVDDGSTDGTAQIAQSRAGVRYTYQANQGSGSARNTGLAAATGDFIAFLDADDLWLPGKLHAQMEYLLEHPDVGFVLANMESFLEPGTTWPAGLNQAYYAQRPVAYLPSALVCRRRVFDKVGLFDAQFRTGEDSDWFFRARDAGVPMAVVPHVLIRRRIHSGNLTQQTRDVSANLLKLVRASVDRKRRAPE
jgi:glycosyltransferase involved in cell wall biosynthesis